MPIFPGKGEKPPGGQVYSGKAPGGKIRRADPQMARKEFKLFQSLKSFKPSDQRAVQDP
jgi:hypothetical protein